MPGKLEKFNKKIEPYYALLTMILFFGGIMIAGYKYLIAPSDLKLTVKTEATTYPTAIGDAVARLYNRPGLSDSSEMDAAQLYKFLVTTTSHKKLILSNNSGKTLRGINFKYLNVDQLTAYGANAGYLTTPESDKLMKSLVHDEARKIVYFPNTFDLPNNSDLIIDLWGSFKNQLMDDDIIINYDEGEAFIQNTYTIDGVKGYLINYYFEFALLILLLFSVCYIVGIDQIKKRYANQETGVEPN